MERVFFKKLNPNPLAPGSLEHWSAHSVQNCYSHHTLDHPRWQHGHPSKLQQKPYQFQSPLPHAAIALSPQYLGIISGFLSLKFAKTLWRVSFCFFVDEVPNGSKTWPPIPWVVSFTSSTFIIFHLFVFVDLLKTQQRTHVLYIENRKPSSFTNWMKL